MFDAYVAHQLQVESWSQYRRKGKQPPNDDEIEGERERGLAQTQHYLSWLANQLRENNIPNNFLIEQMQPSWLEASQKWQYRLLVGLIFGLIGCLVGLILGLIVGLIVGLICWSDSWSDIWSDRWSGK